LEKERLTFRKDKLRLPLKNRIMKKWLFMTLMTMTLMTFGCGGGGGDDGFVAQSGGTSVPTIVPNPSDNDGVVPIAPGRDQTFDFPDFTNSSRLTVVANFQTPTETSNQTGTLTASLSDFGALPRAVLNRADPRSSTDSGVSPCGYADVCAITNVLDDTREQSVSEIRPRYEELAEGAQEDFFLVPAFRSVTGEKILGPDETLHCIIFAEVVDGTPALDRTKALAIAQAFDTNNPERPGSGIYDQVRAVFGSEWNQNPLGGNDGDEKVVIFFFSPETLGQGLFGYVSPADGNPGGGASSNKGEILYVNSGKSNYQTLATISHEFQHLINQNEKVNQQGLNPPGAVDENISVNEGLSGLSEEICGYTYESGNDLLVAVTNDYLEKPEEHEFFNFFAAGLGYGQGYLFFRYVREHFGDETIRAISTDTGVGLANLNNHLPGGFPEIFRRWTIANYATNLGGDVPSIYKYPSGFRTDGTYAAGSLVGVKTFSMTNGQNNVSPILGAWGVAYLSLENEPGFGLTARITPAGNSAFGVVLEQTADFFTSFQD
jgi:hypothetical protein